MLIPDSFCIAGHTVTVKKDARLPSDTHGLWMNSKKTIKLAKFPKGTAQSYIDQVFFHELVHCLCDTIGRIELSEDEGFVDAMSEALMQALLTSNPKMLKDADDQKI
tara:strand:+ start:2150 stop:2470 length:321 start_codon:yes stop_codon:yes gene_type:complete